MVEFEVSARYLIVRYTINDLETERYFPVLYNDAEEIIMNVAKFLDEYNGSLEDKIVKWGLELTGREVVNNSKTKTANQINEYLLLDLESQLYPSNNMSLSRKVN